MNKEQAVKFISEQRWIFAKTYAKTAPHEYIMVFPNSPHRKEAEEFYHFIQKNGYVKNFFNKKYKYINIEGYKYWTMISEQGFNKDWSINREPLK